MFLVTSNSGSPIATDANIAYETSRGTSSCTAITTDANVAYGMSRGIHLGVKQIMLHNVLYERCLCIFSPGCEESCSN